MIAAAWIAALPIACDGLPPALSVAPVESVGMFRHVPTGMLFPERVAGFERVRIAHLSADGSDAAVAYDLVSVTGEEVAATVWLHRGGDLLTVGQSAEAVAGARAEACATVLDQREAAMTRDHIAAAPPRRRLITLAKDGALRQGRQVTSSYAANFAGRTQAVRTELDLFCDVDFPGGGSWTIEYRFSAPARDGVAAPRIAAFMGALDWRGAGPP